MVVVQGSKHGWHQKHFAAELCIFWFGLCRILFVEYNYCRGMLLGGQHVVWLLLRHSKGHPSAGSHRRWTAVAHFDLQRV